MNACAYTGPRPEKLPYGNDESDPRFKMVKQRLMCETLELIRNGVTTFLVGMARGTDIMAAELILQLRMLKQDVNIQLWAVVPYDRQALSWPPKERARYNAILAKADKVEYISHDYYNGCLQKRNRYMVDNATHLIAVYDGVQGGGTKQTIDYARKKGLNITIIEP